MLFLVIENFKNGDPVPVYRRFRDQGRLAPEGLQYVASWVDDKLQRCFQVMEASGVELIDEWMGRWNDIVDFEVVPVISSAQAVALLAGRL